MLRAISLSYPFLPRLVPDGIFEERTELAVVLFQQNFGLPPTGTVDNDTWDAIASVYRGVVARTRLPRGADVYPSPSFRVEPGGETLHLLVVQSMFKSLSHVLDEETWRSPGPSTASPGTCSPGFTRSSSPGT